MIPTVRNVEIMGTLSERTLWTFLKSTTVNIANSMLYAHLKEGLN